VGSGQLAVKTKAKERGKRKEERGKRKEARGKRKEARGKRQEERGKRKEARRIKGKDYSSARGRMVFAFYLCIKGHWGVCIDLFLYTLCKIPCNH